MIFFFNGYNWNQHSLLQSMLQMLSDGVMPSLQTRWLLSWKRPYSVQASSSRCAGLVVGVRWSCDGGSLACRRSLVRGWIVLKWLPWWVRPNMPEYWASLFPLRGWSPILGLSWYTAVVLNPEPSSTWQTTEGKKENKLTNHLKMTLFNPYFNYPWSYCGYSWSSEDEP